MNPVLFAICIVTGVGILCAVMLVVASKFMAGSVDQKESDLREALPGVNCGACGYSGCDEYAKALANGECQKTNLCIPGSDGVARQLANVLGVSAEDVIEQVAVVRCNGSCEVAKIKAEYDGIPSCAAAKQLYGGQYACQYGCLGFGDCAVVCPQDAICVQDGVARINTSKCIGCGLCAEQCPNGVIFLLADVHTVTVACSNQEKGGVARKQCAAACIGCKKCEKACPSDAIHVIDNLARIDYEKCTACGKCVGECPVHCIRHEDLSGYYRF